MLVNVDALGKTCSSCKKFKGYNYFYKSKAEKDGYKVQCKECHRRTNNKYTGPKLAYYHKHRKANPKAYLIKWSKARAVKKNILHTITEKDLIFPDQCPYLKVPFIDRDPKYGYSIDRIDPTKGYTSDNIQIISRLANAMKFNATPKEMVQFATSVLELHTQGG